MQEAAAQVNVSSVQEEAAKVELRMNSSVQVAAADGRIWGSNGGGELQECR